MRSSAPVGNDDGDREAALLAQLSHENVVTFHGISFHNDRGVPGHPFRHRLDHTLNSATTNVQPKQPLLIARCTEWRKPRATHQVVAA
jgi:hypothetical protein